MESQGYTNENINEIFAIILLQNNKIQYLLACNQNLNFDLIKVINKLNEISDGKGSGKSNFVRGGTSKIESINQIISYLTEIGFSKWEN